MTRPQAWTSRVLANESGFFLPGMRLCGTRAGSFSRSLAAEGTCRPFPAITATCATDHCENVRFHGLIQAGIFKTHFPKDGVMTDGETRFHLLAMCTTLREHLKQTEKLTAAVDMLLARDPQLRAQYHAAQKKEGREGLHAPDPDKVLLRLQQQVQAISGEDRL